MKTLHGEASKRVHADRQYHFALFEERKLFEALMPSIYDAYRVLFARKNRFHIFIAFKLKVYFNFVCNSL